MTQTPATHPASASTPAPMFDRELSWLKFNARVLEEALDPDTPLLERLRFLSIFSSNLDEFFMIRVSGIKQQVRAGVTLITKDGRTLRQRLTEIREEVTAHCQVAQAAMRQLIHKDLPQGGVRVVRYADLDDDTRTRWAEIYHRKVHPTLIPLAVSPTFPFPFISNLSLNLGVFVTSPTGERRLARVKIPDHLPRLVCVEEDNPGDTPPVTYMPIEDLIAANLGSLFPGMEVGEPQLFRVTRDADMEIQEDEAEDLLRYLEEELRKRRFGETVRLEVMEDCPKDLLEALKDGLELSDDDVYALSDWIDLQGLSRIVDLDAPSWKHRPFAPKHRQRGFDHSIFEEIFNRDLLLHHPFDSFSMVADFIRAAAQDPNVLAIKQTLYRTSANSPVIGALLEAAENGKQVAAVVELKARFDEENNITWARRLEEAGVHVIYGVPALKTHCKLCLVIREEENTLMRYAHIGTGNYNPITARVYTDLGLFTSDAKLTADISMLFNRLTGFAAPDAYQKLLVAPRFMRKQLMSLIKMETEEARAGRPAKIVIKANAIIDRSVVGALYEASQAGVSITLLIRGICGVIPGREGLSENIEVRSVVGRFLEHSRVYWFHHGGLERAYIGSADAMGRNLNRRIEVLIPVEDPTVKTWLRDTYLYRYMNDCGRSRQLTADGDYIRVRETRGPTPDVHQQFLDDLEASQEDE